jgi:hypothetical protein
MSWAAVAIGGASLASGFLGSQASGDAARASKQASQAGIDEQRRQFDIIMGLQRPDSVTGTGALNNLARLYGLPYQNAQSPYPQGSGLTPRQGQSSGSNAAGGLLGSAAGFGLGGIGGSLLGGALGLGGGYKKPKGTLGTDQVLKMLKGGSSIEDIVKLAPMSSRHMGSALKKLTKAGLNPDQINSLYGGPAGAAQAEWDAANPNGGVNTPSGPDMSVFTASPDYQFRRDEGMRDLGNSFAARGGAFSGNALRGITDFNSNLASGEFGNYFNRMASLAGIGQTAANNQSNAAMNTGNNITNLLGQQGDARASGIMGQANSWGGALNSGLNSWLLNRGGYFGGGG